MAAGGDSGLIEAVMTTDDPVDRWRELADGLARLGLDQINYAYLDLDTHSRVEARCAPAMCTMQPDWVEHYVERQYDLADDLVGHVRSGGFAPRFYSFSNTDAFTLPVYANEAREAGLNAGLVVPLCGDTRSMAVTAGIMFGSSLPERETQQIMREQGPALVALAHVFHAGMVGEFRRRRAGVRPLTPREKDCLQFAALGMRTTAVAGRLGLAESTVELHFANARRKLRARTLTEAVARALQFQQIELP